MSNTTAVVNTVGDTQLTELTAALLSSLITGAAALVIFFVLQRKQFFWPVFHTHYLRAKDYGIMTGADKINADPCDLPQLTQYRPFAFVKMLVSIPDDVIFNLCGMDVLAQIVFLRTCLKAVLLCALIGIPILIPVYTTGESCGVPDIAFMDTDNSCAGLSAGTSCALECLSGYTPFTDRRMSKPDIVCQKDGTWKYEKPQTSELIIPTCQLDVCLPSIVSSPYMDQELIAGRCLNITQLKLDGGVRPGTSCDLTGACIDPQSHPSPAVVTCQPGGEWETSQCVIGPPPPTTTAHNTSYSEVLVAQPTAKEKWSVGALEKPSLKNVGRESPRVWATVILSYFFVLIICHQFRSAYSYLSRWAISFKSLPRPESFSVLVSGVPPAYRSENKLKGYFNDTFSEGSVVSCSIAAVSDPLSGHISTYLTAEERLGNACAKNKQFHADGEDERARHRKGFDILPLKMTCCCACRGVVDSEEFYTETLDSLIGDIRTERDELNTVRSKAEDMADQDEDMNLLTDNVVGGVLKGMSGMLTSKVEVLDRAFLQCRHISTAAMIAQSRCDKDPDVFATMVAPDPRDLYWSNFKLNKHQLMLRRLLTTAAVTALIVLWFIPVGFVASLSDLDELGDLLNWEGLKLNDYPGARTFIQGLLPPVFLAILMALVRPVLGLLAKQRGFIRQSDMVLWATKVFFIFQIVHVFLFSSVGAALITKLKQFAERPLDIPKLLGAQLTGQAAFFMNYLILQTFSGQLMDLLNVGPLVIHVLKKGISSATAKDDEAGAEQEQQEEEDDYVNSASMMEYDIKITYRLLALVIVLTYAAQMPLILVVGFVYFGLSLLVDMFQGIYVYEADCFETGGNMWPLVFDRLVVGLYLFILLTIGILISYDDSGVSSFCLVPLLVIIFLWARDTHRKYQDNFKVLPRNLSLAADQRAGKVSLDKHAYTQQYLLEADEILDAKDHNRPRHKLHGGDKKMYHSPSAVDIEMPPVATRRISASSSSSGRSSRPGSYTLSSRIKSRASVSAEST